MAAETSDGAPRVRTARRHDVPALVDLRVRFLAETARIEPRFALMPDVREKTAHAMPVWLEQEDRLVLVAEDVAAGAAEGPLLGYATGLCTVWPPVWKLQRVGEVLETYVEPRVRGRGLGRQLLRVLTEGLVRRGAQVLRAPVPSANAELLHRYEALGYRPVQFVMERNLEEV